MANVIKEPLFDFLIKSTAISKGINARYVRPFLIKSKKCFIETEAFNQIVEKIDTDANERALFNSEAITCSRPFPIIWFEFVQPTGKRGYYSMINNLQKSRFDLLGVGFDFESGRFFYAVGNVDDGSITAHYFIHGSTMDCFGIHCLRICSEACNYLSSAPKECISEESIIIGKKRKLRKGKRPNELAHVIVINTVSITDRFIRAEASKNEVLPTDWQHRWSVRGHWRRVKRFGRDAKGNRIEGRTWVRDFVKGPEDKPLVDKIRIVR